MIKNRERKESELIENVLLSTENALKALISFEHSLIKSRYKEGVGAYTAMCKALVGQRIWTVDKNNPEIENNFQKIAQTSQSIIGILKPYVQCFEKLAVLQESGVLNEEETVGIAEVETPHADGDEKKLLEIITKHHSNQISYTNLRSLLGWERKKLDEVLATLANKGNAIAINTSGSRKMIHLNT